MRFHFCALLLAVPSLACAVAQNKAPIALATNKSLESITLARISAANTTDRSAWQTSTLDASLLITPEGNRLSVDQWWKFDSENCGGSHCAVQEFHVESKTVTPLVTYRLIVSTDKVTSVYACQATYVAVNGSWKVASEIRSSIQNAGRIPAPVDPKVYESYAGKYTDSKGEEYTIIIQGPHLYSKKSDSTQLIELFPLSPTQFFVLGDQSTTEFVLSPEHIVKEIKIVTGHGDIHLQKIS